MTIRAVIVDDEPLARAGVRVLLDGDPDIEVVAECGDPSAAVDAIGALEPDLLFLDVQMPGMDGFDVLRAVPAQQRPVVIMITAWTRHAIDAFDARVCDYVVKPIDRARFARAVANAKAQIALLRQSRGGADAGFAPAIAAGRRAGAGGSQPTATSPHLDVFAVRDGERTLFVPAREVRWIEAVDDYVRLHTAHRTHLLRRPLRDVEARLDPDVFFRIHRSVIVQLAEVREVHSVARGRFQVVLVDGSRLPLSRARRARLEAWLGQRI